MRLAVTGCAGQVASALLEAGPRHGVNVLAVGRPNLDLADPGSIAPALAAARPDIIVSAAAYTQVDRAESEPDAAFAANAAGASAVAAAAAALGVPVIHLSTDYVFDGGQSRPYVEADPTGPLTVYGRSKLAGEGAVAAAASRHVILRTAWVYSPFGSNFVRAMLRLSQTQDRVRVVDDQRGAPTSALDIAEGILTVAGNLLTRPEETDLYGLFHMTAAGEASWADLAEAVFDIQRGLGGPAAVQVDRIATADYPTPARRPARSVLDSGKLLRVHGVALPSWRSALAPVVQRLVPHFSKGVS
jgi:dTDP-4-dehydrorhamnose reductase